MMRVLIADDHDLVRDTVAAYLLAEGVTAVTTAADVDQAMTAQTAQGHDVVLLDYTMPGMNGLEGVKRFVTLWPATPIAVLSGTASRDLADASLKAGARGFLPKTLGGRQLVDAVRRLAAGETVVPNDLLAAAHESPYALTRRETDVLRGLCAGKSNKEIARDLELQEVTVKLHVKTLSRKLGARNRTHAAMIARDEGLI
jgi:two-component system, NarL family, nitrate/nitrite response regulator NarL